MKHMSGIREPKTLQAAVQFFTDPDNALGYMVARRWPDGVVCPTCGNRDVRFISTRRMWQCKTKHARQQFSIKVGTIFEDSAIPLDKSNAPYNEEPPCVMNPRPMVSRERG